MIIWVSFLHDHKICLKVRTEGFLLWSQTPGTVHKHNRETLSVTEPRKQVCRIRYCKLQRFVILSEEMLRLCQKIKWKRECSYGMKIWSGPRNLISSTILTFFVLPVVIPLLVSQPATPCLELILKT